MRETKDQSAIVKAIRAPHTTVSAIDYEKLAIAHIRAIGGEGVVLMRPGERGHQPAQWRAWIAYFHQLDPQKGRTYQSLRQITAPTAWPLEFDLSALPAPPYKSEERPSPERRRELADKLRALVAQITPMEARPPTWRNMTPATAAAKLDELKDRFASDAPMVNTREMANYLASMREEAAAEASTDLSVSMCAE
jgi:hypothetical protein